MGILINTERVLEGNLCSLRIVLMSQFDSDTKDQVENMSQYSQEENGLYGVYDTD